MDFVQRNLINERNNLQVELAKAKALIAQLSEGMQPAAARRNDVELARLQRKSKIDLGVRGPHKEGEGITPAGEGAQNRRLAQQEKTFPMAEQAEYISDLENVIASIAESMNMSVEELMEVNSPRNMARLAAMVRQHNSGPSHVTGFRSGLKPVGGDIQPATNVGYRLAGMLGSSGVHGAAENMQGKVVASQRHPSGGYNQDSSIVTDKTPVEFKNPDVKPDTMARAAAKVRDGSKGEQQARARTAAMKAAAAERASRTF